MEAGGSQPTPGSDPDAVVGEEWSVWRDSRTFPRYSGGTATALVLDHVPIWDHRRGRSLPHRLTQAVSAHCSHLGRLEIDKRILPSYQMRTLFPDHEQITRYGRLKPVVFGAENVVNFFKGVVDGDELFESLQGKNIFYILEFVGKGDTDSGLRGRPTPYLVALRSTRWKNTLRICSKTTTLFCGHLNGFKLMSSLCALKSLDI